MQCTVKVYAAFGEFSTATSVAFSSEASENEDLEFPETGLEDIRQVSFATLFEFDLSRNSCSQPTRILHLPIIKHMHLYPGLVAHVQYSKLN